MTDIAGDIMISTVIVVDANVILRGLRSRNGACHALLRSMLSGTVDFALSPPMVLEYEDVVKRPGLLGRNAWISDVEIDIVLDALCAQCTPTLPWFRFRPFLNDPKDGLYIECALSANAPSIVSDDRHFRHPAVAAFGLSVLSARDFDRQDQKPRRPS